MSGIVDLGYKVSGKPKTGVRSRSAVHFCAEAPHPLPVVQTDNLVETLEKQDILKAISGTGISMSVA